MTQHRTRSRNQILYIGSFQFPEGDAGAARVLGIGKALRESGYEVVYAGIEKATSCGGKVNKGEHRYQGFRYFSPFATHQPAHTILSRGKRLYNIFSGSHLMRWLQHYDLSAVCAIIAYQAPSALLWQLQHLTRTQGIALIADCVEWYDHRNMPGGLIGPFHCDSEIQMRLLLPRIGNIITISSYLQRYYATQYCRVVRVPPLVDLHDQKWKITLQRQDNNRLRFVYAGTPGKKDLLGNVIRGLAFAYSNNQDIELNIYGPTYEQVVKILGKHAGLLNVMSKAIIFHDRLPQSSVPERLAQADFIPLLRFNARYAQAGFPTKVVEAMTAGTPIMANATSDIDKYVHDGRDGIILQGYTPQDFADGIKRALMMPPAAVNAMKLAARLRASEVFDYHHYVTLLGDFLREACASQSKN